MKNKIKNIVLGIMLMCSVLVSSVNVQATELSSAESAVVDIESYQVIEGALNPGEQITLEIVVKNNSFVSDSQNTVMTLESINGTLAPVYGEDNQIYIGTIPANGTARVQVSAVVNKQYNADAAQMVCYFNYVSGVVALSNKVTINIPTNVSGNLIAESVVVAEKATVGINSLVSIRYKNDGTTMISDAKLIVTGNVKAENKEIPLSTVGAGKTATEDYYVNFIENGTQILKLELQYTDSKGEICIVDCGEYAVEVINNVSGTGYDAVIERVDGFGSLILRVLLLGVAGAMIAVLAVGYIKKNR